MIDCSFTVKENPVLNVEIWKKIRGLEAYEVSNLGSVRSSKSLRGGKPLLLSQSKVNSGYRYVSFTMPDRKVTKKLVHRLVAEAFCSKFEGKDVVNHINGDKLDNRAENLEWVTQAENLAHARATGATVYNKPTLGQKLKTRYSGKPSKYFGVFWASSKGLWVAAVVFDKVRYGYKCFKDEEAAARYRDELVVKNNLPLPLNFN